MSALQVKIPEAGGADPIVAKSENNKKPVAEEIALALKMHESRDRSDFPVVAEHHEEKKDDDAAAAALIAEIPVDEPVEEGQEALWVENEKDLPSFVRTDKSSVDGASKSPSRRSWKMPSPRRNKSASPKSKGIENRVFLIPKDPPKKPSPLETTVQVKVKEHSKQREAAQKVETARKLLSQALSPSASAGSRDLLARAAFEHATEARRLLEPTTTPELETLLKDATVKGKAEVAMLKEQLQLQLQESKESNGDSADDEHASRARNLLEFILPEIDTSILASPSTTESPNDVSTLGFDNTYVGKGGSKDFDVLSMSSLNEILDGPIPDDSSCPIIKHRISNAGRKDGTKGEAKVEESVIKHRIVPAGGTNAKAKETTEESGAKVEESVLTYRISNGAKKDGDDDKDGSGEGKQDESGADGDQKDVSFEEEESIEVKAESTNVGAKRSGFFGGIFRGKHKEAHKSEETPSTAEKKAGDKKATPPRKWLGARKKEDKKAAEASTPERFLATVHYTETNNQSQGIFEGEISNLDELEKIKEIDGKLNRTLQDALDADDNESMTSLQGVPIHGKEEKPKQDDSKEKKGDGKEKSKNAQDAVKDENSNEKEAEAQPKGKKPAPSRIFEASRPTFVAAPKGDPAILTSQTWESLEESPPRGKAPPVDSRPDENSASSASSNSEGAGKASLEKKAVGEEKEEPPSPDSTRTESSDGREDRYTVAPVADGEEEEDRYKVPDEEESFEAFWDPCSPKILTIIPSADTCSTLGMAAATFLSNGKDADEDESDVQDFDKYETTTDAMQKDIQNDTVKTDKKGVEPNSGKGVAPNLDVAKKAQEISNLPRAVVETRKPLTDARPVVEARAMSRKNLGAATTAAPKNRAPAKKKKLKIAGVVSGLFAKNKNGTSTPPRKTKQPGPNVTPSRTSKVTTTEKKSPTPSRWKNRKQKEIEKTPEHRPGQSRITDVTNDDPKVEKEVTTETPAPESPEKPEPVLNDTVDSEEEPVESLGEENVPGNEDPLVAQIKAQARRPTNRGLDPTTVEEEARRGIDP